MKSTFLLTTLILFFLTVRGQSLVFVFLNSKADKVALPKAEVEKIMEGHMANINRLAKEGKLIAAGPFDGGGGMFIFKAASIAEATEWLQTDPGVKANRWNLELFPFTPRVGSACSVSEPYQMVNYEFVRYTVKYTKYNVRDSPETASKHEEYLGKLGQTGNVVAEGSLGQDGSVLIMRGELDKKMIEADPGIMEDLYQIEYKKLYIAKGSFCEK